MDHSRSPHMQRLPPQCPPQSRLSIYKSPYWKGPGTVNVNSYKSTIPRQSKRLETISGCSRNVHSSVGALLCFVLVTGEKFHQQLWQHHLDTRWVKKQLWRRRTHPVCVLESQVATAAQLLLLRIQHSWHTMGYGSWVNGSWVVDHGGYGSWATWRH